MRSLMRKAALKPVWKRKLVHTTDSKHDLPLAPTFSISSSNPTAPNLAYVSDITDIRSGAGWLHLGHRAGAVCARDIRLEHDNR
jgi:hypothetical protein